jgi:hypothetical protein
MTLRQAWMAALLMLGCAVPAAATAPVAQPPTPAAATATSGKASTPAAATATVGKAGMPAATRAGSRKATVRASQAHPTATASRSAAPPSAGATVPAGPASTTAANRAEASKRTLDDIHIEGEIPVPQVLFITTRDQRRFMGFQYRRYLRTSRKLGEDTAVPSRIIVTDAATMPERSHSDD